MMTKSQNQTVEVDESPENVFSWMLVNSTCTPEKNYLLEPENGRLEEEISNLEH